MNDFPHLNTPPYLGAKYYQYFNLPEIAQMNQAYYVAWLVHFGKLRMKGLPYITHPVAIVHIAMDEFQIYDSELNIAAILHDTDEPSVIPFFNSGIQMQFGVVHAENNHLLTKNDTNKSDYLKNITNSGRWVVILTKLLDRLHNMSTLKDLDVAFQKKQANETREFFLDLCFDLEKVIPAKYKHVPHKVHVRLATLCLEYGC